MLFKILLLTLLLFIASGVAVKANAQESPTILNIKNQKSLLCTSINSYLLTYKDTCENKKLSQIESVIKAAVSDNFDTDPVVISHAFETEYYVKPTIASAPISIDTQTYPTPTSSPIQQYAHNLQPAERNNLDTNLIFDLMNQHRVELGKPPFVKDEALCSLAHARSNELSAEFANGSLHSGLYNRNLPYWITENAKWGSNEKGTVRWWLNSPVHRRAIEGDYSYSCGSCYGTQCSQLFTSYTSK